jgi:hypothetical protein
MKLSKCKICRSEYRKLSISHKTCKPECAIELVLLEKAKKARTTYKAEKVRLRSRWEWLKLAQAAFNAYIRKRDEDQPCISCGRHHSGQYHAGHYLTTGARPELRFDEMNVHKQCSACNNHLSGNVALYRIALIAKVGQGEVDRLEGPHEPKKYTIPDLQEIIEMYKEKMKALTCNTP